MPALAWAVLNSTRVVDCSASVMLRTRLSRAVRLLARAASLARSMRGSNRAICRLTLSLRRAHTNLAHMRTAGAMSCSRTGPVAYRQRSVKLGALVVG